MNDIIARADAALRAARGISTFVVSHTPMGRLVTVALVARELVDGLRRETEIMGCHCPTARYRPHEHGVPGCTGIPVVVTRWVSDWELADEPDA